uniref:TOPBP1 interacting checkpoint and replication regulator n=1 Tax=Catagonus wagneri TaxID=51154 RepID=A0A8C3WSS7_9CETA
MACCHNVMLLLDTAGGAAGERPVRRAALRLLTYLSCTFGLARVRWAFRFFDSQGARSRPSRVSDFRELGVRSWEDFEEELEARLGDGARGAHLPGPAPRATHTHSALMETLLDYQWDRPEITSPTKPILRSSRRRLLDVEGEAKEAASALGGFVNAVFLLGPCPHSQRELLQFVAGCEAQAQRLSPSPKQVMEKLLPRRVQEVMIARKITLYWVDTTELPKLWESPDHVGYWTVCELLHHVGGTVLPFETFSQDFTKTGGILLGSESQQLREPRHYSWISTLPTDSTLNCLLYNSHEYEASFPRMEGTLFFPVKGKETQEAWTVMLEPLAMHQRHFQKPVRIFLKGTVTQWSLPTSGALSTDSWMLQSPEGDRSTQRMLFQELVNRLATAELHLVASVDPGEGWPPITGVISPFSASATVLTVFHAKETEFQRHFLQAVVAESPPDSVSLLSEIVDGVLNQIHSSLEDPPASAPPVPEWAKQELGRTTLWSSAIVEKWFPCSNFSGASSNLMESFWLLQAASSNKEESSKTESEVTRCLSELYQGKSREESTVYSQEDSKKRRGVPRTPVRQKMNTMCRSLKMLNVARLNVKAQKLHPDGSPDTAGEKEIQKIANGRTTDKLENRGRTLRSSKPKDFKTEEELLSYIQENYQKTMATGGTALYSCARNVISNIKGFLKSKGTEELDMNCLHQVRNNLLKTSKSLRQDVEKLDKEDKVRECQLQVFLRLEMCVQCPSIHESIDDMEQVVEETTDLLRMMYLAEDSAHPAKFLEEILALYSASVPETLGKLYNSLGFVIPQKLAGVLPTDFFSDDSMTQESKSPLSVPLMLSACRSVSGGTESDQLEELRTRSAKKRRKNAVRHKSIAEVSQNLRQIEIPKVSKRTAKNEDPHPALQQPLLPVKDTVQEVTKVRRNLFNQEMISPSKRSIKRGLPRSHSVSAVEGLDSFERTKGFRKLLTKSVAETPVHKQVSRRLLHKQIKGRSSDPGLDVDVVEESPEKGEDEVSLRRSPRIKQLSFSRTNSGSFYSVSQPKSRSIQRVHSFQQAKSDQRGNSPIQSIRSPKRLLFGAVSEMISPSEKGSARIKRPSGDTVDSANPTAYQTPEKRSWKCPSSSKATPRRYLHTPQTPLCTPERPHSSPAETTPAKQVISKEFFKDSSSQGWDSPCQSKVTPQKGHRLAEGASPLKKILTTPQRTRSRPPRFLQNSAWPSVNSSPGSTSCSAALVPSAARTRSECLTPGRYSPRTPAKAAALGVQREVAFMGTPPTRKSQLPGGSGASQAEQLAQRWQEEAVKTPGRRGSTARTSPETPVTPPLRAVSKSPLRFPAESPSSGELDWQEARRSPSTATSPCGPPSTPSETWPRAGPAPRPPAPPSKTGKGPRRAYRTQRSFLEGQPNSTAAPRVAVTDSPAAITDTRRNPEEAALSPPPSPERRSYPGAGREDDWCASSHLLTARDPAHLTLPGQAAHHGSENVESDVAPVEGREGSRTGVAGETPSPCHPGIPPSSPSSRPSSPATPSYDLRCTAGRRQRQAAAQLEALQAAPRLPGASASPQTYEVELEMQASGLPKLRFKKVDAGPLSEAGPLQGGESTLPGLSVARPGMSSGKPEATYLSPACLRPSHSTPGKSGGQTYICRSCTPTRGPSSTPSPFQTDGLPWTPSPKRSGKTTPDSIKDWPRRKRAVGCSLGPAAGRVELGPDLPGGVSLLEPEGKEQGLGLSITKTPILGDSELGVCKLPDQSPPRDSVPKAEEAFSWGQFGLGSRKRFLSAEEEAEGQSKRVCDEQKGDSEVTRSEETAPGAGVPQRPRSGEDEEVFPSGATPPPSCAVRSCLSASGLQALTHSPLLFQAKMPSSRGRDTREEDVDAFPSAAEDSPFSRALSRRRPVGRTYSRKKLLS